VLRALLVVCSHMQLFISVMFMLIMLVQISLNSRTVTVTELIGTLLVVT